jgi:hypothetical protein
MDRVLKIRLILLLLSGCFIGGLALEGYARLSTRGPRWVNPHYVEISASLPELNALIEDTQNTAPPKHYDEFLYAPGPVATTHINFTDYYSSRLTPDSRPIEEADIVIWTFGGSTMENTETTDEMTIANTIARVFNERAGPTHVKNFGAGGFFSSYELIKFQKLLREVPENELPYIAIFYDGYNDSQFGFQYGAGSLQKDLSQKIESIVEHRYIPLWLYTSSRLLSQYSKLWQITGARLVDATLFPLPDINTNSENLNQSIRIYTSNVRMIEAICDIYDIRCFFVLQPLIVTKNPLSELERQVLDQLEAHPRFSPEGTRFMRAFYQEVINELAENDHFIDASRIMDGRTQPDFYDVGHTSALSSPYIGERIADYLLSRLEKLAMDNAPH